MVSDRRQRNPVRADYDERGDTRNQRYGTPAQRLLWMVREALHHRECDPCVRVYRGAGSGRSEEMKRSNRKDHVAIARNGWMPFWWGNKFIKRLTAKREREYRKSEEGATK